MGGALFCSEVLPGGRLAAGQEKQRRAGPEARPSARHGDPVPGLSCRAHRGRPAGPTWPGAQKRRERREGRRTKGNGGAKQTQKGQAWDPP